MEALIILPLIGISLYLLYNSLTSTKYNKALKLYRKGNIPDALHLLESVLNKHPGAPARIAEIKIKQGKDHLSKNRELGLSFLNQVFEIRKRLQKGADLSVLKRYEAEVFFEIANLNFYNISNVLPLKDRAKAFENNIIYIDKAEQTNLVDNFRQLKTKHHLMLSELFFDSGMMKEKAKNYIDAMSDYNKSVYHRKLTSYSVKESMTLLRIQICRLKNGELIDRNILEEIHKSPKSLQDDFYYRYARKLIEQKNYHEAGTVIHKHLNSNNKSVHLMMKFMQTENEKNVLKHVNDINKSIDGLYKDSFSIDETVRTYENLDNSINSIKAILPEIYSKLDDLRPGFFNRILSHYIEEHQYSSAINIIQKFKNFWNYPEIVKNLGICCNGFVNQGKVTEKNYKTIISSWLTAVYSDKVILKSLENTSWDDDYTFTLIDSIGSRYSIFSVLPENVNYDEMTDTNISIGATQRELLNNFESSINKFVEDKNLMSTIQDYYSYEKNAIEKIISIIDKDILMAGPYFAKMHEINNEIITCLEDDYANYSNEDALEAGIAYLSAVSGTSVRDFAKAKDIVEKVTKALERGNLATLKEINSSDNKSLISKYKSIKDKIEDSLFNLIAIKIEEDDVNENLIKLMEEVIKFSPINEKLKYQYSNYVSNYCIEQVNDELLSNYQALLLMKRAYLLSPLNSRICKNFVSLIHFNLMDILNDRTNKQKEIYKCLDDIYPVRTGVFKQNAGELSESRAEIVSQLQNSGVDISVFESNTRSLTSEGEKIKKTLYYLKVLSSGVRSQTETEIMQKMALYLG